MLSSEEAVDATGFVCADSQQVERVLGLITMAFAADPPNRWLFSEPEEYLRYFPVFASALGGASIPRGTAVVAKDFSAAALWLAPDVAPDEHAIEKLIEENVAPDKRGTIAAVIEQMAEYHPQEPHWYLPFIGVDPARQGKGVGSKLLQVSLARCADDRLPAYLESTNPRNQPFYERAGFEALAEIRVGDCPPIVPMVRWPDPT